MDFEIPEDITVLDDAALSKALEAGQKAAAEYAAKPDAEFSDEDVDKFEALTQFVAAAKAAQTERAEAAQARIDRLAAARGSFSAEPAEGDEGEDEGDEDADEDGDEGDEGDEEGKDGEAVVASGNARRRSTLSRLGGRRQAEPPAPQGPSISIVAAANVPTLNLGSEVNMRDLSIAAREQFRLMSPSRMGVGHQEFPLAQFRRNRTDGFSSDNRTAYSTDDEMLDAATSESRLRGGSLVAAGGWCAPSETLYDVFAEETAEGLWDLPSTNWGRGGINFTRGPQFADFYAQTDGHWWLTEAQVEAGTEKTFIEIDCPDFTEVRLDAVGVGVKVPLLTEAAYPEYVQRFISGTLIAQQHRVSATLLQKALTIAGAATTVANPHENATAILTALELVVEGERQRYRLSPNATLEAVAPIWLRSAIRADLAQRTGVDMLAVTDQTIDAYFASRGVRMQFVYNWQALTLTGTGGVGPAIDFPGTVEVLLYPAGTFAKGTNDIVDLRAVYDAPTLATNRYTALFAEEGVGLAWRRFKAQRISIALNVTGRTAAADISHDWGTAQATTTP